MPNKVEFGLNFKGVQTFGKNSINSPNFFLDMIFMSMNLDGLTCIKKFEVPLQVANMTKRENSKMVKLEFESTWIRLSL
jgi:hypothetical protein